MSMHQVGNSQSSARKNVLSRSSGSSAVLGDMVSQQTLSKIISLPLERKLLLSLALSPLHAYFLLYNAFHLSVQATFEESMQSRASGPVAAE